jgi:hypothetical protein
VRMNSIFFAAALALSVAQQALAQTTLDQVFNEEGIERFLSEVPPEVGYLSRVKMMKGHLQASLKNAADGKPEDSQTHVHHPMEEIWPQLEPDLEKAGITDVKPALLAAEAAMKTGDPVLGRKAVEDAFRVLTQAERIAFKDMSAQELVPDVVAVLLRSAVIEYHEAFTDEKLSNLVEYHDGAFFVREAKNMLDTLAIDHQAKNPEAYAKMNKALEELFAAWPETVPPDTQVLPVVKMQTLVSIAELQLNKLR